MQYTAGQVATICQGRIVKGTGDTVITGVSIDSRQLRPGQLFVALRGERQDGHAFVGHAFQNGAAAALVAHWPVTIPVDAAGTVIQVTDPQQALQLWATHHRRLFKIPVVAVTGSVGKTSTKEMIAAVLSTRFKVFKSPGNYNNELGVPLGVLQWDAGHGVAVFEVAMRGRGQIAELAAILQPDIGVVTNVGDTHVGVLGSREAIAQAKAELVEALNAEGVAVLNADDQLVARMRHQTRAKALLYGLSADARIRAVNIDLSDPFGTGFTLVWPRGEVRINLPVPGHHHVYNALAAASVGFALGVSSRDVAAGLAAFETGPRRMEFHRLPKGPLVVDDTYNASPASLQAAFDVVARLPRQGRLVLVLGDMLELGPMEAEAHRRAGERAARICDLLMTYGDAMAATIEAARTCGLPDHRARHYRDQGELIQDLIAEVGGGDVVLVKGSRGMRMEKVVEALLARFAGDR